MTGIGTERFTKEAGVSARLLAFRESYLRSSLQCVLYIIELLRAVPQPL